jgi:hypothetical protein
MHRFRTVRFAQEVADRALGDFEEDLPILPCYDDFGESNGPILPFLDPIQDHEALPQTDLFDDWTENLPPLPPLNPIRTGARACSSGPAFWCASDENFRDCIQSKGFKGTRADFKACRPYGTTCPADVSACSDGSFVSRDPSNNCNFAPCGNVSDRVCSQETIECEDGRRMPRDPQNDCQFQQCPEAVGECAQGPAFWCSSDENFNKCVTANGYVGNRASLAACRPYIPAPEAPVAGQSPCTQGPDYWCGSPEAFSQCVATDRSYEDFCAPYRQPPVPVPTPDPDPTPAPPQPQPQPQPQPSCETVVSCPHCGEGIRGSFVFDNYTGQNPNISQSRRSFTVDMF